MEGHRERQKLFIYRERVRRELIHTKPGETICLQYEQVELLLKWIKTREETIKEKDERIERLHKYGFAKR